jgi:hypothetical protein
MAIEESLTALTTHQGCSTNEGKEPCGHQEPGRVFRSIRGFLSHGFWASVTDDDFTEHVQSNVGLTGIVE